MSMNALAILHCVVQVHRSWQFDGLPLTISVAIPKGRFFSTRPTFTIHIAVPTSMPLAVTVTVAGATGVEIFWTSWTKFPSARLAIFLIIIRITKPRIIF